MVRRAFLIAVLALAACGTPSGPPAQPKFATLDPGPVIRGGFVPSGTFTPLRAPLAVAAGGPDVYVLDTGGILWRIDAVAMRMVQFLVRPAVPGVRLAVDADSSVYLLDPAARRIDRFARDGRPIQSYTVDATVGALGDFARDPRGRLVAADPVNRQIIALRPLGGAFELIAPRADPRHPLASLDAVAIGRDGIYVLDARSGEIAQLSYDGHVLATFGQGQLVRPSRLATDRYGRLFVLDGGSRAIKVFRGGQLIETVGYGAAAIVEATDFSYADGWLYVADGPGAQVHALRVRAPRDPP